MIKHIFLTGRIQVGKSTLLYRVLSDLENQQGNTLEYDGFRTYFDFRKSEFKKLYMERYTSDETVDCAKYCMIQFLEGRPQMQTLAYETEGIEILSSLDTKKLLIFDECGKFERNSTGFIKKMAEILDGDTHGFGVLRKDDSIQWLQDIANRDDVCVIEVTEENRDTLKEEVKALLLKILREK